MASPPQHKGVITPIPATLRIGQKTSFQKSAIEEVRKEGRLGVLVDSTRWIRRSK